MKVDVTNSRYHETATASAEFSAAELKRLRFLLRRLRFLEGKSQAGAISDDASGGSMFVEWEVEALEFVLTELDFLEVRE